MSWPTPTNLTMARWGEPPKRFKKWSWCFEWTYWISAVVLLIVCYGTILDFRFWYNIIKYRFLILAATDISLLTYTDFLSCCQSSWAAVTNIRCHFSFSSSLSSHWPKQNISSGRCKCLRGKTKTMFKMCPLRHHQGQMSVTLAEDAWTNPESCWPPGWTFAASSSPPPPAGSLPPWRPPWVSRKTRGRCPCRSRAGGRQHSGWPPLLSAPCQHHSRAEHRPAAVSDLSLNWSSQWQAKHPVREKEGRDGEQSMYALRPYSHRKWPGRGSIKQILSFMLPGDGGGV